VAKGKRVSRRIVVYMNGKQMTETKADFEGDTNVHLSFEARRLRLWSPSEPVLYRFDVETEDDRLAEMTGFRTVEYTDLQ
jgi:beta-galactosidase/beta-glucuronidase